MADYPTLPDPDPLLVAAHAAIAVMRGAKRHMALLPPRAELESAAVRLEDAVRDRESL